LSENGVFIGYRVSVLFSEPKIPQYGFDATVVVNAWSFSALQRAENSSIRMNYPHRRNCERVSVLFSEPKIPQSDTPASAARRLSRFQCSSASRKFLNVFKQFVHVEPVGCFSALQRAENSSIVITRKMFLSDVSVSVLFSEPKIPQSRVNPRSIGIGNRFSALQRAENSSILSTRIGGASIRRCFSALQRAENSSIVMSVEHPHQHQSRFSALQRAENSSIGDSNVEWRRDLRFSALQRAENSSIGLILKRVRYRVDVSVLFSEPKIPQSGISARF